MRTMLRILAVPAWVGVMVLLYHWSETDSALAAAAVATVALGVAVGRWWALLVPAMPALYVAAGTLIAGSDEYQEVPAWAWAAYVLVIGLALVVLVALGVWLHRLLAPPRRTGARAASHG